MDLKFLPCETQNWRQNPEIVVIIWILCNNYLSLNLVKENIRKPLVLTKGEINAPHFGFVIMKWRLEQFYECQIMCTPCKFLFEEVMDPAKVHILLVSRQGCSDKVAISGWLSL